jgi:hypothetical protein
VPLQPARRTPSTRRRSIIDMTKRFHAPQHSTAPKHPPRNKRRGKSLGKVLKGGAECKGPRFFVGFIGCSTSTVSHVAWRCGPMVSVPGSLPEAFSLAFCCPGCCWPVFLSLRAGHDREGEIRYFWPARITPGCCRCFSSLLLRSGTAIRLYLCIPFMPPFSGVPC